MTSPLGRIVNYTKKIDAMVDFYRTHFGFHAVQHEGDRIIELRPEDGGATLMLHPAAKSQKMGQVLVKLVFDVRDVEGFCQDAKARGLTFGAVHRADGYVFSNAKDPSGNSISVSSRAFVQG